MYIFSMQIVFKIKSSVFGIVLSGLCMIRDIVIMGINLMKN